MPRAFWGGFAQGLAQGVQHGIDAADRRKEHELRAKMIEQQLKEHQAKMEEKTQERQNAIQAAEAFKTTTTGGTPGYESTEQQMSVAPTVGAKQMTPQEHYMYGQIKSGAHTLPAGYFRQTEANRPTHIPMESLIPDPQNPGQYKPAYTGGAIEKPMTSYQKAEVERQNRGLDIQAENAKATREATTEQRHFTNQQAAQAAADRSARFNETLKNNQRLDEQRRAQLYLAALKEQQKNEPGMFRKWWEKYGAGEAPASREEVNSLVESLRPSVVGPAAGGGLKPITAEIATQLLKQAGGDKNKARALAREQGYQF